MKTSRTLQDYKVARAWLRLCQEVMSRTEAASGEVLKAKDSDRFEKMANSIKLLSAKAESEMIKVYPESWYNSSDVFFGTPDSQSRMDDTSLRRSMPSNPAAEGPSPRSKPPRQTWTL